MYSNSKIKLRIWVKKEGVYYKTAWNWWKTGNLPVKAIQMPSWTVLIQEEVKHSIKAALYARVLS